MRIDMGSIHFVYTIEWHWGVQSVVSSECGAALAARLALDGAGRLSSALSLSLAVCSLSSGVFSMLQCA